MLLSSGQAVEADLRLKEANVSYGSDPTLRAFIASYLANAESWAEASAYASQTRKMLPDDVHALCTLGAYHYHLARESKVTDLDRNRDFVRASEAFVQALLADPACAVAAQGLAIAIAEDFLPTVKDGKNGVLDSGGMPVKSKSIDIALGIFTRIKDSIHDRGIHVNIGHCYFFKGDEEQAIESVSSG